MDRDYELTTRAILDGMKKGENFSDQEINFTGNLDKEKAKIFHDIDTDPRFHSRSEFCDEACITSAHLSMFYHGTKNMDRDHLLRMFITLQYDIDTIMTYLRRFDVENLYPRNPRDYIIIKGIIEKQSLDDIDYILEQKGLTGICFETKKSKKK